MTLAVIAAWVVGIFAGRVPDALHSFMAAYVRYSTHLFAYVGIVADPYPGFMGASGYPVDLEIAPPDAQSRLTILFRLILAIPAAIVANVLQNVAGIVAILAWFYALFTGDANKGMRDLRPTACATRRRRTRTSCSSRSGTRASPTTDPVRVRDRRLPHRRRAVSHRHRRRRAARGRRRSSTGGATRSSASTTCGGCSSTSRAATPTCTAATSSSRTTTAPTSGSSSSTTTATRPRAATGRSRSSRGRSTTGIVPSGARARTASSSTCRPAGSRRGRRVEDGRVALGPLPQRARRSSGRRASSAAGRRRRRRLRRRVLRVAAASGSSPRELPRLIELGRRHQARSSRPQHEIVHPLEPELRDVYGVIFWQHGGRGAADPAQRDRVRRRRGRPLAVRLAAPRRGSRSSTRRGAARAATSSVHLSIVGTEFRARVVGEADVAGRPAVVTEVEGSAYRTGRARLRRSTPPTRSGRASSSARGLMRNSCAIVDAASGTAPGRLRALAQATKPALRTQSHPGLA